MRVDVEEDTKVIEELTPEGELPVDALDVGGIVSRSSLARGRSLSPGIQSTPFFWRDIVHAPPPRRRKKGDCTHVTWHGADDSGDVRLSFTTCIRVDPGLHEDSSTDDIIHVEERLYVQRRLLQEFIDRERAFTDRVALRMRSRLAQSMVRQRRLANRFSWAWAATAMLVWIRFQAKAGTFGIQVFRAAMRSLVALPDAIFTHTERVSIHLASQTGRKTLRRALYDPMRATPQEKTGLLVLLIAGTAAVILLASAGFATFLSAYDRAFSAFLGDFLALLAGTLALPIPGEVIYITRAAQLTQVFPYMGYALAGVGLFAGKMMGCWMLYLLGDSLFDTMSKKSGPKMLKAISWLQRNAEKWGFTFLLILNLIPLAPDGLIIVFAVSGMRFRNYMGSIMLGTILKIAILAGLIIWVGPAAVQHFVEHPIDAMRGL